MKKNKNEEKPCHARSDRYEQKYEQKGKCTVSSLPIKVNARAWQGNVTGVPLAECP